MCSIKAWSISSACKNLRAQHPLRAEIFCPENVHLAKFGRFLTLPNFTGRAFQKLYARYHHCLASRRLEKFHENISTGPEVIGVHTLNFKPNFKFSGLEFFGGTPVPLWVCAIKACSISSACKNLRAQHPLGAEILCAE